MLRRKQKRFAMEKKVTGIILAGGKSSRMGEDKSFLPVCGRPLIAIVIETVSALFKNLIIITNQPALYKKYSARIEADTIKDCGPLGGIYTGLRASKTQHNFVCACDMPFLNKKLIQYILENAENYDMVLPYYHGRYQPLCALYAKSCLRPIGAELQKGNLKITNLLKRVRVKIVSEDEIKALDPEGLSFVNINTPHDYERFKNGQRGEAVMAEPLIAKSKKEIVCQKS